MKKNLHIHFLALISVLTLSWANLLAGEPYGTSEEKTYTITVENDGRGTAKADKEEASLNTVISLTATPNDGYGFKEWVWITPELGIEPEANCQFTMPNADVTIKATFKAVAIPAKETWAANTDQVRSGVKFSIKELMPKDIVEILLTKPNEGAVHLETSYYSATSTMDGVEIEIKPQYLWLLDKIGEYEFEVRGYDDLRYIFTLNVTAVVERELKLSYETLVIKVGDEYRQLKATILPEEFSTQYIEWGSDDTEIAHVYPYNHQEAVVEALSKGTTTIRALSRVYNLKASCEVTITTSSEKLESLSSLALSPNPTKDFIHISGLPKGTCSIKLINPAGRTVLSSTHIGTEMTLDLSKQPSGTYLIVVENGSKRITERIVKL